MGKIKKLMYLINKITDKYKPITQKITHDNIFAIAGQSAFFILLSSVPLLMFIVSILHNLNIPVDFIEKGLSAVFSKEMTDKLSLYLTDAYSNSVGISFITLIVTLWSASKGIHSITNGLNRVYDTYENRNWLVLRIRSMIITILFFAIILVTLTLIVLGSTINELLSPILNYVPDVVEAIYHLRFVVLFAFFTILFALLYKNVPNLSRKGHIEYGFKNQLPGAMLCTISWFVLSFGISIYVDNFNGFSIYGGLARLAVLMIWLYFCMVSLMICAEINFVYHDNIKKFKIKYFYVKMINKYK